MQYKTKLLTPDRGTPQTIYYYALVSSGQMTLNEARAAMNMPPIEGGDTLREETQSAGRPPESDETRFKKRLQKVISEVRQGN